jgi:hypothetical protein
MRQLRPRYLPRLGSQGGDGRAHLRALATERLAERGARIETQQPTADNSAETAKGELGSLTDLLRRCTPRLSPAARYLAGVGSARRLSQDAIDSPTIRGTSSSCVHRSVAAVPGSCPRRIPPWSGGAVRGWSPDSCLRSDRDRADRARVMDRPSTRRNQVEGVVGASLATVHCRLRGAVDATRFSTLQSHSSS